MKKRTFDLSLVTELTLYTGTNGKPKCTCNCPGCSQTKYSQYKKFAPHQGTLTQIQEIISLLPNLKKAYLLGNPDCSVDTTFCCMAAKLFIKNGIHVMFSTSGVGGAKTIQKLTNGLDVGFIDYISFSIDSLDPNVESMLKGRKVNIRTVLSGIEFCKKNNIPVKIQPTIWQSNQDHMIELMDFFYSTYQIDWFTFHVGSHEGFYPTIVPECMHVLPDVWLELSLKLEHYAKEKNLNAYIPKVFLTADEYETYKTTYVPHCVNPDPTNIQIWMGKYLYTTFYPLLATADPEKFISILDDNITTFAFDDTNHHCPMQNLTIGSDLAKDFSGNVWEKDDKKLFVVCRYYKAIT